MENVEKLIKLIFKEHLESSKHFQYDHTEIDILRASVSKLNFEYKKLDFEINNPNQWFREKENFQFFYDSNKSLNDLLDSGYIGFCTRTGGHSGGSCFGGEPSYEKENDPEMDNDYLDKILEVIAPDVTYLTYRKIEKNILIRTEYTKHEYYGNNDIYYVHLIPIKPLIEILQDKKFIISNDSINQFIIDFETKLNKKKLKP